MPADTTLSCQNLQGYVKRRHDLLRDAIFKQCTVLDGNAEIRDFNFVSTENSVAPQEGTTDEILIEQRATERTIPGDIVVKLTTDAPSTTFYDITVVNCLTQRSLAVPSNTDGPEQALERLLEDAHKRKVNKHAHDVTEFGGRFVPLVVSSTGVWHGDSLTEIRKLSSLASGRRGVLESLGWSDMLAELCCALARGNFGINASRQAMAEGTEDATRQAGDPVEGDAMRSKAAGSFWD